MSAPPSAAVCAKPIWLVLLALLAASNAVGQEFLIPRHRHSWGAFRPGSWKLVKVTTENLDEAGATTSTTVTETQTTLLNADAASYELEIEVTLDVAGRRFTSDPKTSRQGYLGEAVGQKLSQKRLGDRVLTIGERRITTQTAEFEMRDIESRRVTWLHYSVKTTPLVLGRRWIRFDSEGERQQETNVETIALDVRRSVLGVGRRTWETKTTQKHPAGRTVTQEIHCQEVPGGVVEHTSEEYDSKDRLTRRSQLELLSFGVATPDRPPPRRAPRKSRRR